MRTKRKRLNPNGAKNRGFREFEPRLGRADERRVGSVFVRAGRDRRNCTTMLSTVRVGVDALVQLR